MKIETNPMVQSVLADQRLHSHLTAGGLQIGDNKYDIKILNNNTVEVTPRGSNLGGVFDFLSSDQQQMVRPYLQNIEELECKIGLMDKAYNISQLKGVIIEADKEDLTRSVFEAKEMIERATSDQETRERIENYKSKLVELYNYSGGANPFQNHFAMHQDMQAAIDGKLSPSLDETIPKSPYQWG